MSELIEKLVEVDKKVRRFGFTWPNLEFLLHGLKSEVDEVHQAITDHESRERVEEELGDLFHNVIALILYLEHSPYAVIQRATGKFEKRVKALQEVAEDHGFQDITDIPFEKKIAFWREAKQKVYDIS